MGSPNTTRDKPTNEGVRPQNVQNKNRQHPGTPVKIRIPQPAIYLITVCLALIGSLLNILRFRRLYFRSHLIAVFNISSLFMSAPIWKSIFSSGETYV